METPMNQRNLLRVKGRSNIILCLVVLSLVSLEGVAQEADGAIASLHAAAEQGNAIAQHKLGLLYYRGEGVSKDAKVGAQWIERAAIQGLALAQNDIGAFYQAGQGVTQDFQKAAAYFYLAAEQDHGFAQLNIGGLFFNGHGLPQDSAQAAYWFTKASQSDDANAARQGRIWSDRLQERARRTIERQKEMERNSAQQNSPISEDSVKAGLIFLAVALVLTGGGTSAPEQQQFVPYDVCSGMAATLKACGG